jgi:hypothetical protein
MNIIINIEIILKNGIYKLNIGENIFEKNKKI